MKNKTAQNEATWVWKMGCQGSLFEWKKQKWRKGKSKDGIHKEKKNKNKKKKRRI